MWRSRGLSVSFLRTGHLYTFGDFAALELSRIETARPEIAGQRRCRSAAACDRLRWKPWPGRSTSRRSIAGVAGAILVNAPALEGWYLLQGPAVAISHATAIDALLFSGVSRREGEGREIGIARIECSRAQWQKRREEYGDDGKRPLAAFHGTAPFRSKNTASLERLSQFVIELRTLFIRNSF
jgi:hypothetical protein